MSVKTVQAIINGQTYTLTLNNDTGKYEATVTAPAKSSYNQEGHYYPVTVKSTDDAGNTTTKDDKDSTLGQSLRLVVKEKVAPVSVITYPTSGAFITNATPAIAFKVTDEDSGINESTIKLTVDDSAVASEEISKKRFPEDMSVPIRQKAHWVTERIRSRWKYRIMTGMLQQYRPSPLPWIPFHRHCPSQPRWKAM